MWLNQTPLNWKHQPAADVGRRIALDVRAICSLIFISSVRDADGSYAAAVPAVAAIRIMSKSVYRCCSVRTSVVEERKWLIRLPLVGSLIN